MDTIALSRRKKANRTGIDRTTQPVVHLHRHPMCATVLSNATWNLKTAMCATVCRVAASKPIAQASFAPLSLSCTFTAIPCAPSNATRKLKTAMCATVCDATRTTNRKQTNQN